MQIAVLGAGCIGTLIGARFGLNGRPLTLIDLPDVIDILDTHGLRITETDGSTREVPNLSLATSSSISAPVDLLFIALKAHQVADALPVIARLCTAETTIVTVQNGIPWWYFQCHGRGDDGPIEAVDRQGLIAASIDASQLVGCVAYPAAMVPDVGHVVHVEGDRMPVAAVDPDEGQRAEQVSAALESVGLRSRILDDLRGEVWLKAVGTASLNPLSALTRSTFAEICGHPATRGYARRLMEEAASVANALGVTLRVSINRRLDGAEKVGHHRSSMLQDLEKGEALETGALLGSVIELASRRGVAVPNLENLFGMLDLLERSVCAERQETSRCSSPG